MLTRARGGESCLSLDKCLSSRELRIGCGALNPRPSGSVGDGRAGGSSQPIGSRTLPIELRVQLLFSSFIGLFPRLVGIISYGGEAGFIYAHMTSQNIHEMLTQLYLELGLSLQNALRAAEADLKHNSPPGYSASEVSFFFSSEGLFHEPYLLQSRKALARALILTPQAYA